MGRRKYLSPSPCVCGRQGAAVGGRRLPRHLRPASTCDRGPPPRARPRPPHARASLPHRWTRACRALRVGVGNGAEWRGGGCGRGSPVCPARCTRRRPWEGAGVRARPPLLNRLATLSRAPGVTTTLDRGRAGAIGGLSVGRGG